MRAYNRRRAAERAAVPRPARPPRPAVDWDALLRSGRTATEVAKLIGYSLPGVLKQARKRGIVLPRGLPGVRRSERLRRIAAGTWNAAASASFVDAPEETQGSRNGAPRASQRRD
jgi:hypothetical protein